MKRPTTASLKRVNAANLANLGADRLAEILLAVADARPELKRRLRMELAAEQGPDHLAAEIDKRLSSLETLTSKVSWRQRPTFLRDLESLRLLIVDRLTALDASAARERLWRLINTARRLDLRVRDKHGELEGLFALAVQDLSGMLGEASEREAYNLVAAIHENPKAWLGWLPIALASALPSLAAEALDQLKAANLPGQVLLVRALADAAHDVDAYVASFSKEALGKAANAAEVADRLLSAGRTEAAGELLEAASPLVEAAKGASVDFEWESSWIRFLEAADRPDEAQAVRWQSFERTLSVERAKDFTMRLKDFDEVEAEQRAFERAATHANFTKGLSFLMGWPAVAEAGRMIEARPDDVKVEGDQAELWAAQLRRGKPRAANILLRQAAALAFRRRDFTTCDRLTHEADTIELN